MIARTPLAREHQTLGPRAGPAHSSRSPQALFHGFILTQVAMGAPQEWNLFTILNGCFLFGTHGGLRLDDLRALPLVLKVFLGVVEGLVPAQRVREHLQVAAVVGLVGWAGWGLTAVAFASQRADCVIGKPGPGVVAEAAVCGVPFVTERRNVMPQARREPRVRGRM